MRGAHRFVSPSKSTEASDHCVFNWKWRVCPLPRGGNGLMGAEGPTGSSQPASPPPSAGRRQTHQTLARLLPHTAPHLSQDWAHEALHHSLTSVTRVSPCTPTMPTPEALDGPHPGPTSKLSLPLCTQSSVHRQQWTEHPPSSTSSWKVPFTFLLGNLASPAAPGVGLFSLPLWRRPSHCKPPSQVSRIHNPHPALLVTSNPPCHCP